MFSKSWNDTLFTSDLSRNKNNVKQQSLPGRKDDFTLSI